MRKIPTTITAALSFAVGFVIGAEVIVHYSSYVVRETKRNSIEDRGDMAVRSLELLKANNTNATEFLEIQLDEAVIELGSVQYGRPRTDLTRSDIILLTHIKDYWSKFPRSARDPEIDKRVQETMALIK